MHLPTVRWEGLQWIIWNTSRLATNGQVAPFTLIRLDDDILKKNLVRYAPAGKKVQQQKKGHGYTIQTTLHTYSP